MLNINIWLQQSREVRQKMASEFNIPRSSGVIVDGQRVTCDGHTVQDLSTLTVETLRNYTGLETNDFYEQFFKAVEMVKFDLITPPVAQIEPITANVSDTPTVEIDATIPIVPVDKMYNPKVIVENAPKKFCEHCTSKGGRHLKTCKKSK